MKTLSLIFSPLGVAALLAPAAHAEPFFRQDTQLSLGVFFTDQDSETRFSSNLGDGTAIDFEDDLGLDSSLSALRFDGYHRFAKRHGIGLSVFDLSRDAEANLEGEIEWQDTVFPISERLATNLDFTVYKFAYTYEFLQRDSGYLGASLGLYVMDIGISLALLENNLVSETSDVTAPLPVLGLRGGKAFGDRWTAFASAELFFAEIEDVKGTLHDLSLGIEYRVTDHFALALAYNDVELDVDAAGSVLEADLVWGYSGALVSFRVGF